MDDELQVLRDLDHQLKQSLSEQDINTEEIVDLVDKRERLLQGLLLYAADNPEFAHSEVWRKAILQTQQLVEQMQSQTTAIGRLLHKYRYGNKSVQQYKKFL
ncbi:flagellar protein FliT [Vibrio sp. H11]|uniref:flagellar protein FliT n=1 Tax=Vibrio sp. H11 TaxID=2565928 RepID=UPI0010A63782|nr:flagellar protein FliT [Vibrio sp. H11]